MDTWRFIFIVQKKAVEMFYHETVKLVSQTQKRRDFVSESQLLKIGCFLNMLAVLDALKNMKSSLSNDLSMYRRFGWQKLFSSYTFIWCDLMLLMFQNALSWIQYCEASIFIFPMFFVKMYMYYLLHAYISCEWSII